MRGSDEKHLIDPSWVLQPEVRNAIDVSGWPECDIADFFEALGGIIEKSMEHEPELRERLHDEYGFSVGELIDMVGQVAAAEPAAQASGPTAGGYLAPYKTTNGLASTEAREAVRSLFLHGFTEEQIFGILEPSGVTLGQVQDYISAHHMKVSGQEAVRLHRAGKTVTEIARAVGLARATVYEVLEDAGLEPNVRLQFTPQEVRLKIVELRNAGKSQPEIREQLGVTDTLIKNTLRLAARKGLVQDYRTRVSA